jgi:quercetin dioxygenase-like cupin family protein
MFSVDHFLEEAKKIEKPGQFVRKRITAGAGFDIDLYSYESGGENRFHTCSKDEYFFILRGRAEMIVEDDRTSLIEGEGIRVKAGLKHMHTSDDKLWMMVISKWPHEHVYYDL